MLNSIIEAKKRLEISESAIIKLLFSYKRLIKYVISGGTAAITDLSLLFVFYEVLEINVVVAATLAFIAAFFVSFYLQKFWTFRDNSKDKMKRQMFVYFAVGAANTLVNAWSMDLLVNSWHVWYLLAQVIASGTIALYSFIIYKFFIFAKAK